MAIRFQHYICILALLSATVTAHALPAYQTLRSNSAVGETSLVTVKVPTLRRRVIILETKSLGRVRAVVETRKSKGRVSLRTGRILKKNVEVGTFQLAFAGRNSFQLLVQLESAGVTVALSKRGALSLVREKDSRSYLDCDNDVPVSPLLRSANIVGRNYTGAPVAVSVLVLYLAEARVQAGSKAQIEIEIQNAISLANSTYARSGIPHSIELTGSEELTSAGPTAMSERLTYLMGTTDGIWDEVHALRERYKADVVSLVVGKTTDSCGRGSIPASLDPRQKTRMFTVVSRDCFANHSFTHELAHNMGADHDAANVSLSNPLYSFGKGWVFYGQSGQRFHTIMAYSGSPSSRRIGYFSNPDKLFDGVPTGDPDNANNAKVLQVMMPFLSGFYDNSPTPVVPTATATTPPTATPVPPPTVPPVVVPTITPSLIRPGAAIPVATLTTVKNGPPLIDSIIKFKKEKKRKSVKVSGLVRSSQGVTVPKGSKIELKLKKKKLFIKTKVLAIDGRAGFSFSLTKAGTFRLTTREGLLLKQFKVGSRDLNR